MPENAEVVSLALSPPAGGSGSTAEGKSCETGTVSTHWAPAHLRPA